MMPKEGKYLCKKVSKEEFKEKFLFAQIKEGFESYIGYPNTKKILEDLLGIEIPLSREQTDLKNNDTMYAIRLAYRVNVSEKAGNKHGENIEDYEFYITKFKTL